MTAENAKLLKKRITLQISDQAVSIVFHRVSANDSNLKKSSHNILPTTPTYFNKYLLVFILCWQ